MHSNVWPNFLGHIFFELIEYDFARATRSLKSLQTWIVEPNVNSSMLKRLECLLINCRLIKFIINELRLVFDGALDIFP